jgi:hypothetical protein
MNKKIADMEKHTVIMVYMVRVMGFNATFNNISVIS